MLTVWGRQSSSNVQAVMWCIAELDLPVNRIDAGYKYGVVDSAEYLAMNPNGKVPTLCDGDNAPVWESAAILRYLAHAYANDTFWPDNPQARAQVDMWAEWSKINVAGQFTGPIFWQAVRIPKVRRNQSAIDAAILNFEKILEIADAQLARNEFLAGKDFTLADIQLGHILYRYYDMQIERNAALQNIARYYADLAKRAAYQEHVMVTYEELVDSM